MSLFRFLARTGVSLFFDPIEVEGIENVPRDGPLLVVSNHTNSLMDGLVIGSALPRPVSLTAKSTLRKNPLLALVFRIGDVVPFYRKQDDVDVAKNVDSFAEIRARLAAGHAIAVFPEGVSHSDASLREMKSGAARIAFELGGSRLMVLPVGLHYEAKQKFRSALWVRIGEAIDFDEWVRVNAAPHPPLRYAQGHLLPAGGEKGNKSQAASCPAEWQVAPRPAERGEGGRRPGEGRHVPTPRDFTEVIDQRIRAITFNVTRVREALWIRWAAELLQSGGEPRALDEERVNFPERARLIERLRETYQRLDIARIEPLFDELRDYRRDLRRLGISPHEVNLPLHPARAAFFALREAELVVAGAPIFLAGVVQHGAAFALDRLLTRKLSVDLDHWASNAVFYGFVIFPLIWIIGLLLTGALASPWWALLYAIAIPFTLVYAILYGERVGRAVRRARTFLRFLFRRDQQRELQRRGRALIEAIEEAMGES